MKKFWGYLSAFLGGLSVAFFSVILLLKNKISNNTIEITRPKIKNSPEGKQDFISEINEAAKKAAEKNKKGFIKRIFKKGGKNV